MRHFAALAIPPERATRSAANGAAVHFVAEAFKHGKTICVIGDGGKG